VPVNKIEEITLMPLRPKRTQNQTINWDTEEVQKLVHSVAIAVKTNKAIKDAKQKDEFNFYKKNIRSKPNDGGYLDETVNRAFDNAIYKYFIENPEHYYRIYYPAEQKLSPETKQKADEELVKKRIDASLSLSSWLYAVGIAGEHTTKLKHAFDPKDIHEDFIKIKNKIDSEEKGTQEGEDNDDDATPGSYAAYCKAAAATLAAMPLPSSDDADDQVDRKKQNIDTKKHPDATQVKNLEISTRNAITRMLNTTPKKNIAWELRTKNDFDSIATNMKSYKEENNPHLQKVIKLTAEDVISTYFLRNPEIYRALYHPDSIPSHGNQELVRRKILDIISLGSWVNALGVSTFDSFIRIQNAFDPKIIDNELIRIKNLFAQYDMAVEEGAPSQNINLIYRDYYAKAQNELNNPLPGTVINQGDAQAHVNEVEALKNEIKDLKDRVSVLENLISRRKAVIALSSLQTHTNNTMLNSTRAQFIGPNNNNNSNMQNQNNEYHPTINAPQSGGS
jgi:hypothetical protein